MPKCQTNFFDLPQKLAKNFPANARVCDTPCDARGDFSSRGDAATNYSVRNAHSIHRKTTCAITLTQAKNLYYALRHAAHLCILPNRHLTIDWERGGVVDPIRAAGRLFKLLGDGLRHRRSRSCYLWVREDGPVVGQHTHILLYIAPKDVRWFHKMKRRWLKMCGLKRCTGAYKTQHIRGANRKGHVRTASKEHVYNALAILRYLLKHASPDVRAHVHLPYAPPCPIVGKRVGTSQNIGAAARQKCPSCS